MKLIQWTLFIDMLGYRDINGSIDGDEKATEFVAFMEMNKQILGLTDNEQIREYYAQDKMFNLYKYFEISSCFVSDSLIITYKPKQTDDPENEDLANMHSANALYIIAMRLQTFIFHCFKEKGIFLRGGISNKYCYIKDNFAVGEGLIEAYIAESSIAKMPRIVLHPDIEKNKGLIEKVDFLANIMYAGRSILHRDLDDGCYFIDHLGYAVSTIDSSILMIRNAAIKNPMQFFTRYQSIDDYVKRHAEAIAEKLEELNIRLSASKLEDEIKLISSVIAKFEWLKNYHNSKISDHPDFQKYVLK